MRIVKHPFLISATLLWIGFIAAISFMEAWLKFKADGVTLAIGLSIGKLVFFALNKVEWVLALATLAHLMYYKIDYNKWLKTALSILIVQTFVFLPALDARADIIINGGTIERSYTHIYYILLEVIKMLVLIIYTKKAFVKMPDQLSSTP